MTLQSDFPDIPGYRIDRELGRGGMAVVYAGEQKSLQRQVAIKVMKAALAADEAFAERFVREARTAASLQHPNIVAIHDAGSAGHHSYIAMEIVRGGDLKDRLRDGALEPDRAVSITRQIASALAYAHERGFVHRDVKPENILFREDGSAVLTDFGIARATGSGTRMTATGLSIGTPHYMSPEQARGREVDGRSDLYALGVVFYEMLTGKVPFEAQDSFAVGLMHISDAPPALPSELARYQPVLDRLLAKQSDERYQQGSELVADLDRLAQGETVAAAPKRTRLVSKVKPPGSSSSPPNNNNKRQGWLWGLGGGALAAVVATVMYLNMDNDRSPVGAGPVAIRSPSPAAPPNRAPVREQRETRAAPAPPAQGRAIVDIQSTPAGAEVFLGDKRIGTTPFQSEALPAGEHQLRLVSRYYEPWEQTVKLEDDVVERIDATLERGIGRVTVITDPAGAEVWMGGQRFEGTTPLTLSDLPAGEQPIEIRLARYRTEAYNVEILTNETTRLDLALEGGDLHEWDGRWLTGDEVVPFLLEAAEADLAQTRLMLPQDDNAWEKYQRVLAIQPANEDALAGIRQIAGRYVELADAALAAGELERAEALWANAETTGAQSDASDRVLARLRSAQEARRAEQQRRQRISAIQTELARLGRNLSATGSLDAATSDAIRAFERATDQDETGQASQALLTALQGTTRWPAPQPGDVFQDCPSCPEMVMIPAGEFRMGSPSNEPQRDSDEGPQRNVTISEFALAKTEVTFAQWAACVAAGGCRHRPDDGGWGRGNRPVINVSWNDAQEYVRWLSRETGQSYRLPSEAEWEYAARAGTTTRFHTGHCITTDQANFDGDHPASGCPRGQDRSRTVPVGSFAPNAFGLHDMHGNVWEWVQDCWNGSYRGAPSNGSAWMSGDCGRAVLRGGARNNHGQYLRSANRHRTARGTRFHTIGFRVARSVTL